ncbi:hypothetical protein I4U23_006862 [Adineta vaga]|nr:hypothetical protein I4U23_006862 [Adineta vaga]
MQVYFYRLLLESTRTNVSGLLGQMIIQTLLIIFGIGISFPIFFLPSYIYFYKSKANPHKSPVPIDILCLGLIYIICMIIVPTYLIYFLSSDKLFASILSIILLISPMAFSLISLPCRLFSRAIQRCWIINSHRLIVHCQVTLFILSAPLFFISLVSLIMHGSFELIKQSYVTKLTNIIHPVTFIWSIDYLSLFLSLILFIFTNEYLFYRITDEIYSSKIKRILGFFLFMIVFFITPCLAFPLYVAWREYQYLKLS